MPAAARDPQLDEAQRAVDANPRDAAAWHRLGLAQQNLANRGDAIHALSKAAALQQGVARYHHDLGNLLIEDGKVDRAITAYRRALRVDDTLAEVHNDLGTAYFEKQWHAEAEKCFRRAIALRPEHGIAHANLGATLRAQGRPQEGRRAYQRALLLRIRALLPRFLQWNVGEKPASAIAPVDDADFNAARALADSNDFAGALARIDSAIGKAPESADYLVLRARSLLNLGRADEALTAATRAVQLEPGSAEAHCVLSSASRPFQTGLSLQAAMRAVEIDHKAHAAHANLAASLMASGRLEEAEKPAREAMRLAPTEPHYPLNLAILLKDLDQLDEARRLYEGYAGNPPNHPFAMLNMAVLALECNADIEGARAWLARGLAMRRDQKILHTDAVVDLLDGRYETGWQKYESRKQIDTHRDRHAVFDAFPAWDGRALPHERLLVYGEQGLGDEIMFASMFAEVAPLAPRLALLCDSRLAGLFRRSFPDAEIIPVNAGMRPEILSAPDRVVAAGSLGLHFRRRPENFPARRNYLAPDATKSAAWRARLEKLGPGAKIGLSWSGGIPGTGRARRSLTLDKLQPLLELPGVHWISLQYGDVARDVDSFARRSGIGLHAFAGVADDMDELASLIDALDVVVSVCNTTVHLAGAIGKRVLVMAPHVPEWRYGLRGERMLWYPSARVFRQRSFGDWDSVIAAVKAQLQSR